MARKLLKRPALIVVDMQRYFLERGEAAYLAPPRALVPNVERLLEAFRRRGLAVFFTRHAHERGDRGSRMVKWWRGKLPREGARESEIIDDLMPLHHEVLITKDRYSAFEGTNLGSRLAALRAESLVICGVMTNLCVETTARHAFMKEFQPVVVADACASNKASSHRASLANLAYGFAHVVKTGEVLRALKGGSR